VISSTLSSCDVVSVAASVGERFEAVERPARLLVLVGAAEHDAEVGPGDADHATDQRAAAGHVEGVVVAGVDEALVHHVVLRDAGERQHGEEAAGVDLPAHVTVRGAGVLGAQLVAAEALERLAVETSTCA
jgi:hypothetical protein